MINKNLPTYNGDVFTWEGLVGYAEMSDLMGINRNIVERIWDDSCDLGFDVVGKYKTITFVESEQIPNGDGFDLKLVSIDKDQEFSIILWND